MNRRIFTSLTFAITLLAAAPAFADFEDQVRRQLQQQGFKRIEVTSTLLGRTRIYATRKDGSREIIMNPRTGEILRDMWTANGHGNSGPKIAGGDDAERPSRPGKDDDGGSDDDGGDDDGGDDDGGDDGGDDNSGSDDGGDDGGDDNSGSDDGGDDGGESDD